MLDAAVTALLWLWLAETVAIAAVMVVWAGRTAWRRVSWPAMPTETRRRYTRGRAREAVV